MSGAAFNPSSLQATILQGSGNIAMVTPAGVGVWSAYVTMLTLNAASKYLVLQANPSGAAAVGLSTLQAKLAIGAIGAEVDLPNPPHLTFAFNPTAGVSADLNSISLALQIAGLVRISAAIRNNSNAGVIAAEVILLALQ